VLLDRLTPLGLDHTGFELHATEIKSPNRQRGPKGGRRGAKAPADSPWKVVPAATRFTILDDVYHLLATYAPQDPPRPPVLFAAVVEASYRDRSKRAYDLMLNKFDEMLERRYREDGCGPRQRGLIVHDEHQIERDLQAWTSDWRQIGSKIGKLNNIVQVPLFTDSRSSRLLQAADFAAFAVWRHYGRNDGKWLQSILPRFDQAAGALHGFIHVRPDYGRVPCPCHPCVARAL
jgi:hypothetical protein